MYLGVEHFRPLIGNSWRCIYRELLGMYLEVKHFRSLIRELLRDVSRGKALQAFDRELLEMYLGVKHFRSLIGNSWGCI